MGSTNFLFKQVSAKRNFPSIVHVTKRFRYVKPDEVNFKQMYGKGVYTWDRASTYKVDPMLLKKRINRLIDPSKASEVFYNPLEPYNRMLAHSKKGIVYDKKPFKFSCIKGKIYEWCNCGYSRSQPFCDGTHKDRRYCIQLGPVKFLAPETKDYWFCNCKQSKRRPFCDGSHRSEFVQTADPLLQYRH